MAKIQPGAVVRFRERLWVILPSSSEVLVLRPLTGTEEESVVVHRRLAELLGYTYPTERVEVSTFPLPQPEEVKDAAAVHLLWNSARLLLRESAAPLRSLGRISIRPRTYQLVPLLMALRLNPVRLLIADDVGVGKTIEAALIVRELWDRGEIRRFAVLCPPYLCDQWAQELREKFHFQPVVVGSATLAALERQVPQERSVYQHFPVQVISIDFVKRERHKHLFLQHAPELIVVDEAHGAVPSAQAGSAERQLRYELVRALAQDPNRHLLLLTATPHSGHPQAFQRLLGLLDPEFEEWDPSAWTDKQRERLARHLVQRTRADIKAVWERAEDLFPEREPEDVTYALSPEQRQLFERAHDFCFGLVHAGRKLSGSQRLRRYQTALVLLRVIMSSPAAGRASLRRSRQGAHAPEAAQEEEWELQAYVYEPTDTLPPDEVPSLLLGHPESDITEAERRRLRELQDLVNRITPEKDAKLQGLIGVVRRLLAQNFHPIVWCFYVDTAEYVARELQRALKPEFPDLEVRCVTGRQGVEERRALVEEFMQKEGVRRVLVATECLSEGVNLQQGFNAVVHYDLPWNPNRLEQREGRVDRYNQTQKRVKAIRFYGRDNPVDGAVIRVLLNKAREIRRSLGTYVPVPAEEEWVIEALVHALFSGPAARLQEDLAFEFMQEYVQELHSRWDLDAWREKESRTRFAQRAIRPEEVEQELRDTDKVLGTSEEVHQFVLEALGRLGVSVEPDRRDPRVYRILLGEGHTVPPQVRAAFPRLERGREGRTSWTITFVSPTPAGAEYVGRNHPLVTALAQYLLESALEGGQGPAARCGALRTDRVSRLTTLVLLRVRYLLRGAGTAPLLAEEVLITGFEGNGERKLSSAEALALWKGAQPVANIPVSEKRELVAYALKVIRSWAADPQGPWAAEVQARAGELETIHRRLRRVMGERVGGLTVEPQWPPDVLAVLVLQPVVQG